MDTEILKIKLELIKIASADSNGDVADIITESKLLFTLVGFFESSNLPLGKIDLQPQSN